MPRAAKCSPVISVIAADEVPSACGRRFLWRTVSTPHFTLTQSVVYEGVMPAAQHRALSQLARPTNHIARFNNTLRQRVSRLVHEALSFSKKRAHHRGASKLFICHYNLMRVAASSEHYMDITTITFTVGSDGVENVPLDSSLRFDVAQ